MENYRPISPLNSFSNIFEKVVRDNIYSFILKYGLLTHRQHGFRKGLSTETGCADLVQYCKEKLDDKDIVIVLSFDLRRSFDTVCMSKTRQNRLERSHQCVHHVVSLRQKVFCENRGLNIREF